MIVVKVGGGREINSPEAMDAVAADLAHLHGQGRPVVLVHGGNAAMDEVSTALGHPPQFLTSESGFTSRRTDRETLEIFEMVYCGRLNKAWVERLQGHGVNAVGLSGLDGRLLEGRRKATLRVRMGERRVVIRDDWTGTVEQVNGELLRLLLDAGYLPVVTPPAISFDSEAINVDGDRAAAAIAAALESEALVFLTDVPGILERFPDPASLIPRVPRERIEDLVALVEGRMKKKVLGAGAALDQGIPRVVIAQAGGQRPVAGALDGGGTHFSAAVSSASAGSSP